MKTRLLLVLALTAVAGFARVPYPGNDAVHGVTQVNGFVDAYTGNVAFSTRDLVVAGAVGQRGLSWQRHATSRTSQTEKLFGWGHNWAHNWQWEMADAGKDDQDRAILTVREPQGWVHQFTETSPGSWTPAPGVKDRVVSSGDDFTVQRLDAGEVRFTRTRGAFTLDKIVDASGNAWTFAWEKGRLAQITEPAGRWLKVSYGTLGSPSAPQGAAPVTVITQVSAIDGQTVRYNYEFLPGADYPVLTTVAYPDDTTARYTYVAPRPGDRLLLTQASDPRGDRQLRGRVFHYRPEPDAAAGQLLKITTDSGEVIQSLAADSQGGERDYAVKQDNGATVYRKFNPGGKLAEEIDANGFAKKHEYDAGGRGFKTATTDELGRVTRFENDARGDVLKTTLPDGAVKTWQRDAKGRVLAETDELGRTRHYTRDERGRVTKVQHPDGSSDETTYNVLGQVLTRKDRGGAVTTSTYDKRGLLIKVTNGLGYSTTRTYDAFDRMASVTDARGNTTRYERDAAGRVVKTIFADGSNTSTVYDRWGQPIKTVDASGIARTTVYDAFGRATSRFDALGHEARTEYAQIGENGAPFDRPIRTISPSGQVTAMTYDAEGRLIARTVAAGTREAATTRYAYDAAGKQTSITNPRGKTVQFFHDERGRRIKTMSALNRATTTEYNAAGRRISQTDAKGNTTQWTYDAMGRELTKTDAEGHVTRREYDAAGRLSVLIDPKGNTYRFEYDLLGRPTALVYPDGSRETTVYDVAGNKISTINRASVVRTFAYDNRNREIRSDWSDGSQTILKAYDPAGRMTLEDNGVSKITFAYDEAGRLASETQDLSLVVTGGAYNPEPRTVSYTHDADGRKESLGYPDGTFVRYTYNSRGQLKDILGDGLPPPIASYDYDEAGNATRMPRENLTETAREFDDENKVTAITELHPEGTASVPEAGGGVSPTPLLELDYSYDEVGNRTLTVTTMRDHETTDHRTTIDTYLYDKTYQVTGADYAIPVTGVAGPGGPIGSPASTVRFTYDAVGNRIEVSDDGKITRYSVNNLNQYTQVGEFAPTHDRNGNLASMGEWLYRYDAMNRLVEASDGAMTAKFYYDAKNRCVARSYRQTGLTPSTLNLTLNYYDNWNLIEERDGAGAQQARYIHGRRTDEIVLMVNRHGVFYPHHDVLGNVTMLTDSAGKLVERYSYSVEGKVMITDTAGQTLPDSAVGNRWMFTGREWLQEVGLYDYRNRNYSTELGRFLQFDPVRFDANDINLYRYVENNPLNNADPMGLTRWRIEEMLMSSGIGSLVMGLISNGAFAWNGAVIGAAGYTLGILAGEIWYGEDGEGGGLADAFGAANHAEDNWWSTWAYFENWGGE